MYAMKNHVKQLPARFLQFASVLMLLAACSEAGGGATLYFTGACDASAAVALNHDLFVVANDEDNILRVYSRSRPGPPVSRVDFTGFLRPEKKTEESDLEAAAQVGERIYWISSHGRNAKGKERETRHRFFATTAEVTNGAAKLQPVRSEERRVGKECRSRWAGDDQSKSIQPREMRMLSISHNHSQM